MVYLIMRLTTTITFCLLCHSFLLGQVGAPKSEITITSGSNNIVTVVQGGQIVNYNVADKAQMAKFIKFLSGLPEVSRDTKLILKQQSNIENYLKLILGKFDSHEAKTVDQFQSEINYDYEKYREHLIYNLYDTLVLPASKIDDEDENGDPPAFYTKLYPAGSGAISRLDLSGDFRINAEIEMEEILTPERIQLFKKYGTFKKGDHIVMDDFVPFDQKIFSKIGDSLLKKMKVDFFVWNVERSIKAKSNNGDISIDNFWAIGLTNLWLNIHKSDSVMIQALTLNSGYGGENFSVKKSGNVLKI
jgi:hypothetical protein